MQKQSRYQFRVSYYDKFERSTVPEVFDSYETARARYNLLRSIQMQVDGEIADLVFEDLR
jgi:hypothetical protein